MKIIVASDSHGRYENLEKAFLTDRKADMFIFLGDGERDLDLFREMHTDIPVTAVVGNCDMCSMEKDVKILRCHGKNVMATHGHRFCVKYGMDSIIEYAKRNDVDIILYGHTHARHCEYKDGMYIVNPGSVSSPSDGNKPSFAVIDISDGGVLVNIVDL